MQNILTNWRTSLGGAILIGIGALGTFAGVHVPGLTIDFGTALMTGIPLILASDAKPAA